MKRAPPAVGIDRLRELKIDLLLGGDISPEDRKLLSELVDFAIDHAPRVGGRPVSTRTYAGVVGVLVQDHNVTLADALCFADPSTNPDRRESLARTYRALKSKGHQVSVPQRLVHAALRRIREYNERTRK